MRNINSGLAGFFEQAEANGWEMLPTISCRRSAPRRHVTEDAFARIAKVDDRGHQGGRPLDAVYLDLHGAWVTEHLDDAKARSWRACAA